MAEIVSSIGKFVLHRIKSPNHSIHKKNRGRHIERFTTRYTTSSATLFFKRLTPYLNVIAVASVITVPQKHAQRVQGIRLTWRRIYQLMGELSRPAKEGCGYGPGNWDRTDPNQIKKIFKKLSLKSIRCIFRHILFCFSDDQEKNLIGSYGTGLGAILKNSDPVKVIQKGPGSRRTQNLTQKGKLII
jgi:hypothetical protein